MKSFIPTRKSLLAMLVLGAIATMAQADSSSVTIYGTLDTGVVAATNQPTVGKSTGSAVALNTGGDSPSIFGFRGSEDLGGGLKANFNLEGHLFLDTGTAGQWGGLFGRQANVGLSNSVGSLTLGKQYSPAVLAFAATDPRGLKETFSGLISWAVTQMPLNVGNNTGPGTANLNANSTSVIDVFLANAVSLSTKFSDVTLTAGASLGGVSGNTSANSVISLGAVYTGLFTLSAAYQADRAQPSAAYTNAVGTLVPANLNADSIQTRKYSIGAAYSFSDFTITGNYMDSTNHSPMTGVLASDYRVFGLGLNTRTGINNTVTLAYYDSKNKEASDDTSKTWILSDDYALSKRTTLYGLLSGVNAGKNYTAGAAFGVANDHVYLAMAGKTTSAVELGIRHTF